MTGDRQKHVWLLLGDKPGDNGQLAVVGEALSQALGWGVAEKRLVSKPEWVRRKPWVLASLDHLDLQRSDTLAPPWPDLVVTIGRRPSLVALWLSQRAGPGLKLVRLGKPTGGLRRWDLVVVSAEVQMAADPRVLRIGLPLMRVDRAAVAAAGAAWRERFAALPKPLVGLLLGGPTGPYRFDRGTVRAILGEVRAVLAMGGTPWLTTSRRTPRAVAHALAAELPPGARLFLWSATAADNPYQALLGAADRLVVTGDSLSMLTEAARLGRPLQILPLRPSPIGRLDLLRRHTITAMLARAERPGWRQLGALIAGLGMVARTRDVEAFHRMLLDRRLAAPLGTSAPFAVGRSDDGLESVVTRLAALLAEGYRSPGPSRAAQAAPTAAAAGPAAAPR